MEKIEFLQRFFGRYPKPDFKNPIKSKKFNFEMPNRHNVEIPSVLVEFLYLL